MIQQIRIGTLNIGRLPRAFTHKHCTLFQEERIAAGPLVGSNGTFLCILNQDLISIHEIVPFRIIDEVHILPRQHFIQEIKLIVLVAEPGGTYPVEQI